MDQLSINRRKALALLGTSGLSVTALGGVPSPPPDGVTAAPHHCLTTTAMKADRTLKNGMYVQTSGYFHPGDGGGALYIIAPAHATSLPTGTVTLVSGLQAVLLEGKQVNYRMFGANGDGKEDDGPAIRDTHLYANVHGIPVINPCGSFRIRETRAIPVRTPVSWGTTAFYIDERFNGTDTVFRIGSDHEAIPVEVDWDTKKRILAGLTPGNQQIPELAGWSNHLLIITDQNDRVGVRQGYGNMSWPKEDILYIEEQGRILGDISWKFNDFTSITAYPAAQSYLQIEGGTFFLSGDSPGEQGGQYRQGIFTITRSRVIIRNHWVGLEEGRRDIALTPRTGIYFLEKAFDLTLENIRLIPWEQNRRDPQKIVKAGTYGIGGKYVLRLVFRNIVAEGGPVHWGVFGTNMLKQVRIENCLLNRVDCHFHCWGLHISDSGIGYGGITISGGGNLLITDTTCHSRWFVHFRPDYGSRWLGDIRIRNCRFMPATEEETTLLYFRHADTDFGYDLAYGTSVQVADMLIDYTAAPESVGDCWIMRTAEHPSTRGRIIFPSYMRFQRIRVKGRGQGVRLLHLRPGSSWILPEKGEYDGVTFRANASILFEEIDLADLSDTENEHHLVLGQHGSAVSPDACALYPDIETRKCTGVRMLVRGAAVLRLKHCSISRFTVADGTLQGSVSFAGCTFLPSGAVVGTPFYQLQAALGTSFCHCTLHIPRVGGRLRPDLLDHYGFMDINKNMRFNHLHTRLGNDIIAYLRSQRQPLLPSFLSALESHYETENILFSTHPKNTHT